jgi:V-type H+-transporting ATPase subunit E
LRIFVLFCELGKLVQGKMNDSDVSKQVQQMVHFIKQEAEEKANEISVAAEEEFNIEKLQLVEAEKKKIKQEYERKEKQVDVRKKIEYSTQLNASRLKVLQAQDDLIRKMKEAAEKQLRSVSSQADDYARLVEALIIQGLLRLNESAVQLRCREEDLDSVLSIVSSAANVYAEKAGVDPPTVFVDENHFLPGPPKEGHHGSTCAGGVVLATKDGRIVLENTLDARLEVVFKQQLPEIRKRLFPAGGQAVA